MIVDCVTFFNEFDILESRLEYLYDHVDRFVIVESDITFNGQSKPYNYAQNQDRYKPFADKIIYLQFSPDTTGLDFSFKPPGLDFTTAHWHVENAQREHVRQGLEDVHGDSTVLISDVDEIPNRDLLKLLQTVTQSKPIVALEQEMFYYNLKQRQKNTWCGTIAASARQVKLYGPQWCRNNRWISPRVAKGGWHLSYFTTPEQIQYKIENFAHQEYNDAKYTDLGAIKRRIDSGQDLFDRADNPFEPFDSSTLPLDFLKTFGKYA